MNNKNHAKDYLSEFANNKPEWLKVLIKDAIETNGSIEELRINEIFDNLLNGTPLQVQTHNLSSAQQSSQKLLFESLTHISGVNALCENQTIKFSPDVTVLYGLNGSGKSGYFRILNNISGGVHKEIKPNIYSSEGLVKDINVSIKYELGNSHKQYSWTDSHATHSDFYGVKVFDSSYLNGLLQTKNPDETIIREAEEELGYEVKDVVKLGYMIPTCGYSSEKIYLYFGKAARKVKQHFDEDEFINVYKYSFDELKKMVIDGTLDDGKTIALMYKIELMGLDK